MAASPEHDVTLRAGGMAPQTLTDDEWVALGGELPKKAGRLSGFSDEVIAQVLNAASVRDGLKPALSKTLEWNGGNGYRLPTEAEWEAAFADQPGGRLERVLEPEPIPVVPGRGRPDLVLRGRNKERVFRWGRDERALLRLARSLD